MEYKGNWLLHSSLLGKVARTDIITSWGQPRRRADYVLYGKVKTAAEVPALLRHGNVAHCQGRCSGVFFSGMEGCLSCVFCRGRKPSVPYPPSGNQRGPSIFPETEFKTSACAHGSPWPSDTFVPCVPGPPPSCGCRKTGGRNGAP